MKKSTQFLLCAALLPLAASAMAQSGEAGGTVSQRSSTKADVAEFHGNQDTLINAITAIEQSTGGKVLDIRFSSANGEPGFHAAVLKDGKVDFVHLQQDSQNVTEVDVHSIPTAMLHWRAKADVKVAQKAAVPLTTAVRTAEQAQAPNLQAPGSGRGSAPAVAAGVARSASGSSTDVHAYNVLLAAGGDTTTRVAVDASTGQVIADPSTLAAY